MPSPNSIHPFECVDKLICKSFWGLYTSYRFFFLVNMIYLLFKSMNKAYGSFRQNKRASWSPCYPPHTPALSPPPHGISQTPPQSQYKLTREPALSHLLQKGTLRPRGAGTWVRSHG